MNNHLKASLLGITLLVAGAGTAQASGNHAQKCIDNGIRAIMSLPEISPYARDMENKIFIAEASGDLEEVKAAQNVYKKYVRELTNVVSDPCFFQFPI